MTTKEVKFATRETPGAVLIPMGEFRRMGAKTAEGITRQVLTIVNCCILPLQQESQQIHA
jgi:hypothetical protein